MLKYAIKNIPYDDRPREKLLKMGSSALTISELMAIVLTNGIQGKSVLQLAQEVVAKFPQPHDLVNVDIEDLCQLKGMGKVKAIQLKAAISLGAKIANAKDERQDIITTPQQAFQFIKREFSTESNEKVIAILQDGKCSVIKIEKISLGTLNAATTTPREIFYTAIKNKASSMILVHNHPGGNSKPSKEDITVTKNLIKISKIMGIPINDHIIIGNNEYTSLLEYGIKF